MWLPAVTTAGPAAEPVSLAGAKEFCRIELDVVDFDTELTSLIASVREDVETITSTRIITQTVELKADCFADLPRLPIGPVQEVTQVAYLDAAGQEQVLVPGTDFELFGAGLTQGLRPVLNGTWPAAALRASSITAAVIVGYGDTADAVPSNIRTTILRAVRGLFDDKPIAIEPLLVNNRIWL